MDSKKRKLFDGLVEPEYEAEFISETEAEARPVKKVETSPEKVKGPTERVITTVIWACFWLAIAMLACKACANVTLW